MHNIYLVGFMGTGKTSVARHLAKLKKWRYVDLDDVIEKKEKRQIHEIFAQSGEPYFRRLEKQELEEISRKGHCAVACGGGIVIQKDNIAVMKATGKMICLTSSVDAILKRTSRFTHRPLLNVADPKAKIEALLQERAPFYAQADVTIDTTELSVKTVAEKIDQLFPGYE